MVSDQQIADFFNRVKDVDTETDVWSIAYKLDIEYDDLLTLVDFLRRQGYVGEPVYDYCGYHDDFVGAWHRNKKTIVGWFMQLRTIPEHDLSRLWFT